MILYIERLIYHHTCDEMPVPLLDEIRIGHTNYMTKERWRGLHTMSYKNMK